MIAERRPKVLLIEDNDLVRKVAAVALKKSVDLTVVASGEQAFDAIDGGSRFEAIACDVNLDGGMSGVDFYERLLTRSPGQAARLFFISGADLQGCGEPYATDFAERWLSKPFGHVALLSMIERVRDAADGVPTRSLPPPRE